MGDPEAAGRGTLRVGVCPLCADALRHDSDDYVQRDSDSHGIGSRCILGRRHVGVWEPMDGRTDRKGYSPPTKKRESFVHRLDSRQTP